MTTESNKKVLLVTGTTSGMGRVIALDAAAAGYAVVATGRDQERMKDLEQEAARRGVELDIRSLEVTDHDAVKALVAGVARDYGHIDAVVSNAGGVFTLGTTEQITMDAYRFVMETNFYGSLAVIKAALPHLRAGRGRLVVTTSSNGLVGAPYNDAYASSKFALEGAVESLAPVVARFGVKTTIVEPGAVATDILAARRFEKLLPNEDVPHNPYLEPRQVLTRVIAQGGTVQPAEEVGPIVVEVLASDNPPLRLQTDSRWALDFIVPKMAADLDGNKALAAAEAYLALAD